MSRIPKPPIAIFRNPFHDRIGRQTTITDGQGTRTFNYSYSLLLTNETIVAGSTTNSITFTFDTYGRRSGMALHSGYQVNYGYSSVGRFSSITSIVLNATNSWQYQYLAQSGLIEKLINSQAGVTNSRSYDANRNLITEIHNVAKGVTVSKYEYQNDAIGRRTQRIDQLSGFSPQLSTNDFGYNTRSELTNAVMSGKVYGYDYDNIGNRETHATNGTTYTYVANQLNQYTNVHNGVTNSLTYDSDGNLLTDGAWNYVWNGENRMTQASNGATVVTFSYDYKGRRWKKVSGATTNTFLYDGWNLVQETQLSAFSTQVSSYVWGLDLSGSMQGAGGIGGLLSWTRSSDTNTSLYCFDANGNVSELLDSSDSTNVVASYQFDAYGNVTAPSGVETSNNVFRFSTKYVDDETGLSYYGYRYYDARLGRWPSRDPLGEMSFRRQLFDRKYTHDISAYHVERSRAKRKRLAKELDAAWRAMSRRALEQHPYGFVHNNAVVNADLHGLAILDPIVDEANRRRGRGPWGDSAQHCWAACFVGLANPIYGNVAALIADLDELLQGLPGDSLRDIAAQHVGATCALAAYPLGALAPAATCDCCCLSR